MNVSVPKEPTEEMVSIGASIMCDSHGIDDERIVAHMYRTMLAAAPPDASKVEPVAWISQRCLGWLEMKSPTTAAEVRSVKTEADNIPLYAHPPPPLVAYSKSEYKRLSALGAEVVAQSERPADGDTPINHFDAILLARRYVKLHRTLVSGEEVLSMAKAVVYLADNKLKRQVESERELSEAYERCARICEEQAATWTAPMSTAKRACADAIRSAARGRG